MSYLIYYLAGTLIIGGGKDIFAKDEDARWVARALLLAGLGLLNWGVRI